MMAGQQTLQIAGQQAIITQNGQFIRSSNIVQGASILQNGNTIMTAGRFYLQLNIYARYLRSQNFMK